MPKNIQQPFLGCTHHQTPAADVLQWSNWEIRKGRTQWLSVIGLVMGMGVLLFVWWGIRSYWGSGVGMNGGWAVNVWRIGSLVVLILIFVGLLVGMLLTVMQLVRRQTLLVTDEMISFYEVGRWRTYKRRYDKTDVLGLFFGKADADTRQTAEPQLFLICKTNFGREGRPWQRTVQTRIPLAAWMHTADQQTLFNRLREIFQRRQWGITIQAEDETT